MAGSDEPFGPGDQELSGLASIYAPGLFKGKRILITGGGSGIGKALAWLFGRLGAKLIIAGRTMEKLEVTADALRKENIEVTAKMLDIRDAERVSVLFDDIFRDFGGLDVLINNAGGQFPKPALDLSPNGWRSVIDNNLNGTWFMMQAAAKRWQAKKMPGNIINMVVVVENGFPDMVHTCAARAGIIHAAKTLAVEWAQYNIRINSVAPGVIASDGMKVYSDEARKKFPNSNPMKRFGSVWDVAQACAYLASDASSFMTGDVLTLDGGGRYWGELWTNQKPKYFNCD
jgi:NAD(P)-dependent dehydrogenase (short-subunit alcohol dehydrogenase family)